MTIMKATIICAIAAISFAAGYHFKPDRGMCPGYEQVDSEADALEYGKYLLARDEVFWKSIGIRNKEELEANFSGKDCCTAKQLGDSQEDNGQWSIAFRLRNTNKYDYSYYLYFDKCRQHIRKESISEM